ncbi:Hypothetical protein HVR_LOCUS1255 [uncultured virus]|nr:Hypothetical protein HVR_LOCUS1255 [uncultured virus]
MSSAVPSVSSNIINPVVQQGLAQSGLVNPNSNTISVLSAMAPTVQQSTVANSIPLGSTQLSAARMTGFVSSTTPVIPSTIPVSVAQTVNTPAVVPIALGNIPIPQITPGRPVVSTTMKPVVPVQQITTTTVRSTPGIPVQQIAPLPINQGTVPASPTARSALLNLSSASISQQNQVVIPNLTPAPSPRASIAQATSQATTPVGRGFVQTSNQGSLLFPNIKIATPSSSLPLKPTAEIMNQEFQIKDYQGIISNASLENELLNAGYAPLSKIVIRADNGEKRTQYIKALNKNGQKVFILIDVSGYTTARSTDLTLIEAHNASIIPYSVKTGAYQCADKDVCGVAFECGSDSVCVLTRSPQDLTPKEANFVFVEQNTLSAASIEAPDGSIMSYPVVRLSEIRANPALVLSNTNIVTRRLRNSSYTSLLEELASEQQSIINLNTAFNRFNIIREKTAVQLNKTLTQLDQWNKIYIENPPTTDEYKDKYRELQYNLAHRNDDIATLLRLITKVLQKRAEIDVITKEINEIAAYAEDEFENAEKAVSEKTKLSQFVKQPQTITTNVGQLTLAAQ